VALKTYPIGNTLIGRGIDDLEHASAAALNAAVSEAY
jgi:hypothetical protein